MEAKIVEKSVKSVDILIRIPISEDMLSTEEAIQQGVNQVGLLATDYALSLFDTDGTPIEVDKKKYTSKGQLSKTYQCPVGEFELFRHVYQSNEGGSTYCPPENDARILITSTPRFGKMVSQKCSQLSVRHVQRDLPEHNRRFISRTFIQDISDAVGKVASNKPWAYTPDVKSSEVARIVISLDGTCMLMRKDGWRQAMVGSISLYNSEGERLHTIYIAQEPELGKGKFLRNFEKEIVSIMKLYPDKTCIGVADGAAENWKFLERFTEIYVLDYFHASEYLAKVSKAAFRKKMERDEWLKKSRHCLKHEEDGAKMLLKEMENLKKKKISQTKKEEIETAITYFTNHHHQMNYPSYLKQNIPIGSGVIEAACKVIIKQRMCNSGMSRTEEGAKNILVLRCFNETDGKWKKFWDKIVKMGY
jgi:hypothetical protein